MIGDVVVVVVMGKKKKERRDHLKLPAITEIKSQTIANDKITKSQTRNTKVTSTQAAHTTARR